VDKIFVKLHRDMKIDR